MTLAVEMELHFTFRRVLLKAEQSAASKAQPSAGNETLPGLSICLPSIRESFLLARSI